MKTTIPFATLSKASMDDNGNSFGDVKPLRQQASKCNDNCFCYVLELKVSRRQAVNREKPDGNEDSLCDRR